MKDRVVLSASQPQNYTSTKIFLYRLSKSQAYISGEIIYTKRNIRNYLNKTIDTQEATSIQNIALDSQLD